MDAKPDMSAPPQGQASDAALARHAAQAAGQALLELRKGGGEGLKDRGDALAQALLSELLTTHRPHDAEASLFPHLPRHATAWDAIGDCDDSDSPELAMRGKWADLLPSIPEGSNYLHHTDRGEGLPLFG